MYNESDRLQLLSHSVIVRATGRPARIAHTLALEGRDYPPRRLATAQDMAEQSILVLDAPSVAGAVGFKAVHEGRALTLDLDRLAKEIEDAGLVIRRRLYLARAARWDMRDRDAARARVKGWRVLLSPAQDHGPRDRHRELVVTRILAARSLLRPGVRKSLVLVSHDDSYNAPLRAFLGAGGNLVLVGIRTLLGPGLLDLCAHERCRMLRLEPALAPADYQRRSRV